MAVYRDLVDARPGGNIARADSVATEVRKERGRAEQDALIRAAPSGIRHSCHNLLLPRDRRTGAYSQLWERGRPFHRANLLECVESDGSQRQDHANCLDSEQ